MSTNENTPISGQFWDWMQSYWHSNRDFPPAHPDWRKKADLVNGKVPAGQLPSYVDDVLEFSSYADLPQSGEKGKIYITTKDNKQFRWGGSAYIEINSGENVMTLSTEQSVSGRKYFVTSNGSDILNQKLWLRSFDGSNPAAVYYKDGYGSGALGFDGDEFRLTNVGTSAYAYLNTKGIKKDNSNDDHVLTGGGGHISKNDLGASHIHQSLFSEDTLTIDANVIQEDYKLKFNQRIHTDSSNMFPMVNNANSILSIASHPGGYGGQLGFNGDHKVYYRGVGAGTWQAWREFAYTDWVTSQLNNTVGNYLPLTGGTLSGVLNLQYLNSLALNGAQIINAANGDTLYMGNPAVSNFYLESGNGDLLHNRTGYGVGRIWDAHNFNPDSKVSKSGDIMTGNLKIDIPYGTSFGNMPHFELNASNLNNTRFLFHIPESNRAKLYLGNSGDWGIIDLQPSGGDVTLRGESIATQPWANNQLANKVSAVNSAYSVHWDGFQTYLFRNDTNLGYLFHSGNLNINDYYKKIEAVHAINAYNADPLNSFNELNGKTQIGSINADGG